MYELTSLVLPVRDIPLIIRSLCQTPPSIQEATLNHYFTPNASFTHPFCRTGSFEGSRWVIGCIYRWYKIMSPRIELNIDSIAYDEPNLLLYVSMHQVFRIWIIPGHATHVKLVTVLQLVRKPDAPSRYLIASQNDLYQTDQFAKFPSVLGIAWLAVMIFQSMATAGCVVLATLFIPVSFVEEKVIGRDWEKQWQQRALWKDGRAAWKEGHDGRSALEE